MSWNNPHSFPHAIIHIDGDAFFASCEQAVRPELKGKPVVVGKDRGIAAAMSYEAKKRGITRAMPIQKVKRVCPDAAIVSSDFETYSLFSKRMFSIMRRYSSAVEEYGIDEGFIDITGMRRAHAMSYKAIARAIRDEIEAELDIPVSVGLAPTKVLAKIASRREKPHGFVTVSTGTLDSFLKELPIQDVWGIGPNTAQYMYKLGVRTAHEFISKPESYVSQYFTKPHQEIWRELRGEMVYPVIAEEKTSYASISKTRTFNAPSADKDAIFAQLIKNLENACAKARRFKQAACSVSIFLKTQSFMIFALEARLNRASAFPQDIIPVIRPLFEQLYKTNTLYRSTGAVLSKLQGNNALQGSLFEDPVRLAHMEKIYHAVDTLAARFGKHTVHTASSLSAHAASKKEGFSDSETRVEEEKKFRPFSLGENSKLKFPMIFDTI